jgi:hypothetical protein
MGKTIGELSAVEIAAMGGRVQRTLDAHGYDNVYYNNEIKNSGLHVAFRAVDDFDAPSLWHDADVKELRLLAYEKLAFDEDADAAERGLHSLILNHPGRLDREKTHMAWVLTKQLERLGNYSGEARDAFQTAFRRSMEDAGLMALVDARAA